MSIFDTDNNDNDNETNSTDSSTSDEHDCAKYKNMTVKCEDTEVGKMIKYDPPELIEHKCKWMPSGFFMLTISGSSGTGKSVMLRKLIMCYNDICTKNVIIAARMRDNPVHKAILDWCKSEKKNGYLLHEVDEFNQRIASIINKKQKEDGMLIIFDDFTEYKDRSNEYTNCQICVFSQLRNYNACAISIQQQYQSFDTYLRCNSKVKITYMMSNRSSTECFRQEFINNFGVCNKDALKQIFDKWYMYICENKYSFLMMISEPPMLLLNFNKQIYPEKTNDVDISQAPKVSAVGKGLKNRAMLRRMAVDLGCPDYRVNNMTNKSLEEYIKIKSAQSQKDIGNDNPQIKELLENKKYAPSGGTLTNRFHKHINKYNTTKNKDYLEKLNLTINSLLSTNHMNKDEVLYKLKKYGLEDKFKFVDE